MHIAIDVRSLMEGRLSGVEEYTTQIIRAMVRVAPQHRYTLFYNSAREVSLPQFAESVRLLGLRYPNKFFNAAQWIGNWPRWDSVVKADCFFVPSLRLMPLQTRTPLVTTVHDLSFERFPKFFSWQRRIWHRLMRPRQLMKASHHLIAVSQATAADLQTIYQIEPERISVIYSGIERSVPATSISESDLRKKYQLPEQFILYFATLEPRKNIPSIIKAFSAIAEKIPHDLVIAGQAGWLTHSITEALQESAYRQRIHLLGFIPPGDKGALYSAASLFVYPSFYEGFGFPPLEALSHGTPVVTSYNSALPEVVGQWATLINPYDPSELATVLLELLKDLPTITPDTCQSIYDHYSWDTAARQTLRVIEQVVKDR